MRPATDLTSFAQHPSWSVAEAIDAGLGRGVLRHRRLNRPFHGLRALNRADSLLERAIQYVPKLRPGERYSHLAALALLGCPIQVPVGAPVDVEAPINLAQARGAGVRGHRYVPAEPTFLGAHPDLDEHVPIAAPLRAVQQAAALLPFSELVVALDHLLRKDRHRYDPLMTVTPEELTATAAHASGRGARRFREAAACARVGAESRMETLMRLGAMRCGLPELVLQHEVFDRNGAWIGRFDAADPETSTLYEYDGEQHLASLSQRRRDSRKHQQARDAGWRILVLYRENVLAGAAATGELMREFCGCEIRPIRTSIRRLLDERSSAGTQSALPRTRHGHESGTSERWVGLRDN